MFLKYNVTKHFEIDVSFMLQNESNRESRNNSQERPCIFKGFCCIKAWFTLATEAETETEAEATVSVSVQARTDTTEAETEASLSC